MMYPNAELLMIRRKFESIPFQVFDQMNDLIAAFKTPEDAAMLLGCLGSGYFIRYNGKNVWCEGQEDQPAGESYDHVAEVVYERIGA